MEKVVFDALTKIVLFGSQGSCRAKNQISEKISFSMIFKIKIILLCHIK